MTVGLHCWPPSEKICASSVIPWKQERLSVLLHFGKGLNKLRGFYDVIKIPLIQDLRKSFLVTSISLLSLHSDTWVLMLQCTFSIQKYHIDWKVYQLLHFNVQISDTAGVLTAPSDPPVYAMKQWLIAAKIKIVSRFSPLKPRCKDATW